MLDSYMNDAQNPWEIYGKLDKALTGHCGNVAALAKLLYGLALEEGLYPGQMSREQLIYIGNGAVQSISYHHKRFDGSGYSGRLKGEEISAIGSICGLCSYYDVLTSDRLYRRALPHQEAMDRIQAESGRMFDPALVELFAEHQDVFRQVKTPVGKEESHINHDQKSLQTVECIRWEHLPKVVTRDMCIDITGLGEEQMAGMLCIRIRKHKNLIVKSNPGIEHGNLRFYLEGGNLLLLVDVHLKGGELPLVTVGGDDCRVISKGDCLVGASMTPFAIQRVRNSKKLKGDTLVKLDNCQSRIAVKGRGKCRKGKI